MTKQQKTVTINSTSEVKDMVKQELPIIMTTTTTNISVGTDDSLATLAIKAYATVFLKGDAAIVKAFKEKLQEHEVKQREAVDKAVSAGNYDSKGLPRVSAPNDLYNTINEAEQLLTIIHPKNDRIELAGNTVRKFIAETCRSIMEYKKANASTSATVKVSTKTTTAVDSEYANL